MAADPQNNEETKTMATELTTLVQDAQNSYAVALQEISEEYHFCIAEKNAFLQMKLDGSVSSQRIQQRIDGVESRLQQVGLKRLQAEEAYFKVWGTARDTL